MPDASLHRQNVSVAAQIAAQTDLNLRVARIGIEVLAAPPGLVVSPSIPTLLEIFLHNWAQTSEISTSWRTSVNAAQSSVAEERRGLLSKPQRTIDIRWTPVVPGELDQIVPHLKRLADEQLAVPVNPDQSPLTVSIGGSPSQTISIDTTDRRFYDGGLVAIVEIDGQGHATGAFHLRTVLTVSSTFIVVDTGVQDIVAGLWLVFPLFTTEILLEPSIAYLTNHVAEVSLTLKEVFGPNSLPPLESGLPASFAIFKNLPVWDFEPDWGTAVPVRFKREGIKYRSGRSEIVETRGTRARYGLDYRLRFDGRADAFRFMRFFDSRMGRLQGFWQVDQEDIWTIASQSNGDTEVNITALGSFPLFEAELDETEPGHLGIVMLDGTVHIEEVTGIDDETATWEVTLANAIPSLDLTQVRRVARARRVRFLKDSVTEVWSTTEICEVNVQTIELLEEKEVTL